jgi:regulatory protein
MNERDTPTTRRGKRPARRPKVVDPSFLDTVALTYLNRFDASAKRLRQVLLRRARTEIKRGAYPAPTSEQLDEWVQQLLDRYCASGLIDDQRYAENLVSSLRRRGLSRRGIVAKLRHKGVAQSIVESVLATVDRDCADGELEAARQLVRRRRLGTFRPAEQRLQFRRKDLAVLARAGFAFDVAARALGAEGEEF